MTTRSIALLALCFGVSACAPVLGGARPRLVGISPDSVSLLSGNVTELDLMGAAFDASANTVTIGALVLTGVPSRASGTVIRVAIPSAVPTTGEAPPQPWMSGRYPVTVTTKRGTSDTIRIAIRTGENP